MNENLSIFIKCEQQLNNYDLYEEPEWKNFFKINIKDEYKTQNQKLFKLPYFIIPLEAGNFIFAKEYYNFFEKNLNHNINNQKYFPFFVHPATEKMFLSWINNKYEYVDSEHSEYTATPSSSYRSLIVCNDNTCSYFMVKCSIFDNIANGARHIDWKSASGQFEYSQIVSEILSNLDLNLKIFNDIGVFGISGEYPMILSDRFKIKFGSRHISTFGNVIRMIPNDFFVKEYKYLSFASYMSLVNKDSLLNIGYKNSGETFETYFKKYIFIPIMNIMFELLERGGVSLEFHCQNTLLEINQFSIPTGRFFYRDFDLIALDRARFPFLYPRLWEKHIYNRPDRITLYANTSAREDIGINFLNHFLDNLIKPCLVSAVKNNLITRIEMNDIYKKSADAIKDKFKHVMPETRFREGLNYCFGKEMFSKINKKEICVKLKKLDHFIENNEIERIQVWKKTNNMDFDYYKTPQNEILCFQNDILVQIIKIKER